MPLSCLISIVSFLSQYSNVFHNFSLISYFLGNLNFLELFYHFLLFLRFFRIFKELKMKNRVLFPHDKVADVTMQTCNVKGWHHIAHSQCLCGTIDNMLIRHDNT